MRTITTTVATTTTTTMDSSWHVKENRTKETVEFSKTIKFELGCFAMFPICPILVLYF